MSTIRSLSLAIDTATVISEEASDPGIAALAEQLRRALTRLIPRRRVRRRKR